MLSKNKVTNNADFLSLFNEERGLKNLTHDFLIPEKADFLKYLSNSRNVLLKYDGLIEDSLYDMVFGFLFGPQWVDYRGECRGFFCSSLACYDWCISNPHLHPKNADEFKNEFDAFRKSIRFYQMDLHKYVDSICVEKFPSLKPTLQDLRRGNFYVNVRRLGSIMERILSTMEDPRFITNKNVVISYERCDKQGDYFIARIIIEQIGSLSDSVLADSAAQRVRDGGGDLGTIKELAKETCFWSVESVWQDGPARINIVPIDGDTPMIEPISRDSINGFRHVLTIPHLTI